MSAFDARWKYWGKSEVSSFYISTEIRRAPIASLLIWQDHLTKVDIALLTTPKLERQKRNVFSFITDLPVLLEELSGCSEITVPSQYLGLGVLLLNCSNCSKTNPMWITQYAWALEIISLEWQDNILWDLLIDTSRISCWDLTHLRVLAGEISDASDLSAEPAL